MAEHRTYVASFGFFMAAGVVVAKLAGAGTDSGRFRLALVRVALAVALVALASLTIARNRVWGSAVTLWADAARKAPHTWLPAQSLAEALRHADDCPAAIESYRRAISLRPEEGNAYLGMAWCLLDTGQIARAAEALRLGMSQAPTNTAIQMQLAGLEERYYNDPAAALSLCRGALAVDPRLVEAQQCVRRTEQAIAARRR